MRISALITAVAVALALPALAAPATYLLDRDDSSVRFEVDFGADAITGAFPVEQVDLTLDFERAANSSVSVALSAAGAEANFIFATEALRGPSVLDTANHPTVRFESTAVRAIGDTAEVDGNITIRGVTRPITLNAEVFRPAGTAPGDRARLIVRLTGALSRAAFGANGWANFVGDEVRLRVVATVDRSDG
ncbi:MAG: YceI family protein [Pseudomonadota bacterium]